MQVLLEVAIGLVLTFAVLAVVVSSVMELVSAAFRMRARTLEQGIARLLDDQRKPGNSGVLGWFKFRTASEAPATQAVMNHPLIRSLSSARAQDRPPSYIDAITFATAFLGSTMTTDSLLTKLVSDVAALDTRISALPGGTQPNDALKAAWQSAQKDPAKLIDTLLADDVNGRAALKALLVDAATVAKQIAALEAAGDPAAAPIAAAWEIAKVPSKTPAKSAPIHDVAAFIDELATPDLISRASAGADSVHRGIQQIAGGNPHLGKSLNDLWQRADRDFGKFRHEIEDWFDREMARVSGWYSRWSQWIMVVVALVLAFSMNVSAVTIGRALWLDPTVRQQAVEFAKKAAAESQSATPPAAPAASDSPDTAKKDKQSTCQAGTTASTNSSATSGEALCEIGLPIGWNRTAWPGLHWYLLLHILGIIVVGIAASFGAPFWFDALNRLVNLRAGGKPPEPAAAQRAPAQS